MDGADGDDGWLKRAFFAADDGLELGDEFRGEGDGVAAKLRVSAVAADALDEDVDGGGTGHGGTGDEADLAGSYRVEVVKADDAVGAAEALVKVVGEHGPGTVDGFL